MAVKEQRSLIGNAGGDAKEYDTKAGKVVKFSVAELVGYDVEKKEDITEWTEVAVWSEGLKRVAMKIKKGNRVAVIGAPSVSTYDGKTKKQLSAQRIGLVEYLRPQKAEEKPPKDEGSALGW